MRRQRNTLAANATVRVRAIGAVKYAQGVDKTSMRYESHLIGAIEYDQDVDKTSLKQLLFPPSTTMTN